MIVNFLNIFTEYISIVFCSHKAVGKKIKFNWLSLVDFAFYMMLIFISEGLGKPILYVYWFGYIRIRIVKTWKETVKSFCIMLCVIPTLQLSIYAAISENMQKIFDVYIMGIIVNILIIVVLFLWQERYLLTLTNIVAKFRKIIFAALLLFLFKCIFSYFLQYRIVDARFMDQLAICFLIMAVMLILWINSENEKRHKAEELRTYQLYTKTFEDAVTTIRMKQHEFGITVRDG